METHTEAKTAGIKLYFREGGKVQRLPREKWRTKFCTVAL